MHFYSTPHQRTPRRVRDFSPRPGGNRGRRRQEQIRSGPPLNLPGFRIRPLKHLKYLSVIFDPKLTFEAHVNHLEAKCFKRLAIFNAVTAST